MYLGQKQNPHLILAYNAANRGTEPCLTPKAWHVGAFGPACKRRGDREIEGIFNASLASLELDAFHVARGT